jgi:hypothetical protein
MTCELSSSFSEENRLQGSTSIWHPGTDPISNFYYGTSTKVVPYGSDEVYTFVGVPGAQQHWSNSHPANGFDDQGGMYLYRSSSSGIDEIIIGPEGYYGSGLSNYVGVDGLGTWDHANFGLAVDGVSSSSGLHFAVAAPGMENLAGRILLFQSSSSGIEMVDDLTTLTGSKSDPNYAGASMGSDSALYSQAGTLKSTGANSYLSAHQLSGYGSPNKGVSVAFDENEENLYISFYDSLLSTGNQYGLGTLDDAGGIRLYKSSSLGGVEHLKDLIVSTPMADEQVGSAHEMIVANGKVYIAASAVAAASTGVWQPPKNPGRSFLFTYDVAAGTYTEDTYFPDEADLASGNENFGGTPDIVSGSDGIYILQGSPNRHDSSKTVYGGLGRLYLFKSSSSGIGVHSVFTGFIRYLLALTMTMNTDITSSVDKLN